MGKLIDPDKPAYELVEVREDGSALRNDGVELKAANNNPWYRLATVHGEQTGILTDWLLHMKNRRIWNGWACSRMGSVARAALADSLGLPADELAPLNEVELALARARLEGLDAEVFGESGPRSDGLPIPGNFAQFEETYFSITLVMEKFVFSGWASFGSATFGGRALFGAVAFRDIADFGFAKFSDEANFRSATFRVGASFKSATFSGKANFVSAAFSGRAIFESATFGDEADFSDGSFGARTVFKVTKFKALVPKFYQREMHQDTMFTTRAENWPEVTAENAEESKQAYTRLRQIMLQLEKPDDAQFFARQEMRCKAKLETGLARLANLGFGAISDYGYSLSTPVKWLVGIWFLSALGYSWGYYQACHAGTKLCTSWFMPYGLSFSSLFSFFGFNKVFFGDVLKHLPGWLQLLSGLQTVFGFVLLFFLGLGLRNHFRLK